MKIEFINKQETISNGKDFIPNIISMIFGICKNDPHFQLKDKIKNIDGEVEHLEKNIVKQDRLLEQANSIKSEIEGKLDYLASENNRKQSQLLEALGSDL